MALEDLTPAVRVEAILDGADIDPATRLEYFLSKAANEVPKPTGSSDAGKVLTVNEDGDGFELDDVPEELPSYTSTEIGKVLKVGGTSGNPAPVWETVQSGTELENVSLTFDGATSKLVASKTAGEMYDYPLMSVSIEAPISISSLILGRALNSFGYHFYAVANGSILEFTAATANDYPAATVS